MTSNVQMIFSGEILDGFQADEVKRRLAQALKLGDGRVAQLFSGERMVLKDSIEADVARRYVDQLALLGARVHLEPAGELSSAGLTPLPQLPEVPTSDEPPPPPWGTPPRPTRPAPLSPLTPPAAPSPIAPASSGLAGAPQVTCPHCGERQSKRLLCRQCSTNIEMAIAAKDEAAAMARAQRQGAMGARRSQRSARVANEGAGLFGLTFDGRMGRLKYATANLVMLALLYIPLIMMLQRPAPGRVLLFALAALLLTAFGMRLAVLRCHDCDKSGWWSMLLWLPTVNFIVTLVLACAPGTDGSNEYGEQPPPASWAAFGVAALCAALLFGLTFSHLMKAVEHMNDDTGEDDGAVQFQSDPRAASLPNLQAQGGFNESYLQAKQHKAFAVSPSGAWGWSGGHSTQRDAARAALQRCEERRAAYTGPCALVNMDGQWAPDQ
jgi:uncharacterized membrane protein YhaH (DUF805 family)